GQRAGVLRQAVCPRLAGRERLGSRVGPARAPRRNRGADAPALPDSLRAAGRPAAPGRSAALIAKVVVMPKPVVNDPQGLTVKQGLRSLGFDEVDEVRVGKHIELRLDVESEETAVERVEQMCRRLLANQVIEDFRYTLSRDPQGSAAPDLEGASGERPGAPTSE